MAKTKTIENLFNYLALYSSLLPLAFFVLYFKKSKGEKGLWVIVLYGLLVDFLISYLVGVLPHTPLKAKLFASFTVFEYGFFSYFLYLHIKKPIVRKAMIIVSSAFIVFLLFYYSFFKIKGIDSIPIGIETILILLFSFYFLFEQMNDTTNLFIYSKFTFWVILGMLLYLGGSFFIYIFASQLNREEIVKYWIFTNIFSIIKNIFFVIAIAVQANQSQTKNTGYLYTLN